MKCGLSPNGLRKIVKEYNRPKVLLFAEGSLPHIPIQIKIENIKAE
jgi:hypothetical protein